MSNASFAFMSCARLAGGARLSGMGSQLRSPVYVENIDWFARSSWERKGRYLIFSTVGMIIPLTFRGFTSCTNAYQSMCQPSEKTTLCDFLGRAKNDLSQLTA
jgi:hypothetical protein